MASQMQTLILLNLPDRKDTKYNKTNNLKILKESESLL